MNKLDFENWLDQIKSYGIKPGLSRVKELLNRLDNPQNKLDIIHITGTNGKGTTATVLTNILRKADYKVGQFSTPSIISFNHMFDIHGPISDERLFELSARIKSLCEDMLSDGLEYPTEYEIIAAIMYLYFYEEHVDFAVVEVAMGGENDCTNVMDFSILSIITPISLDHTGFLGDTVLDIAKEKSGVIKNNSALIMHPQLKDVEDFLRADCQRKMALVKSFDPDVICSYDELMSFSYKGLKLQTRLMGKHQAANIIGVLEAVHYLNVKGYTSVSNDHMLEGVLETGFEGRFERIDQWILDGAHNHESLMALKDVLESLNLYDLVGVFGALRDKTIDEALMALRGHFRRVILTEPNSFRKLDVELLKEKFESLGYDNLRVSRSIEDAYIQAEKISGTKLGFGSFYMIGDLRRYIKNDTR
ncbi:hypothetical protein EZV73_03555 [Acidaminobacter sp. JC074]|uniref:bifunctional folylpolyglutamate synthase/dihydrofolate synthase n=1 Tax=Acidaminobacter sp. JC074 TaxID=2530199 RepID=UPI001F109D2D|nr:Mur ligase family protein [Acidaminobacter sp. JC074]MCH4886626.1 hypothetical protein [Acidaminobacter sp. JC074]